MEHVSKQLSAYLDGELSADLHVQVETHLSQCSHCAKELDELRQTSAAIQQLSFSEPSTILLNRLHASIEAAARRPAIERFIGFLSGVAACLAIVSGLLLMQPSATTSVVPSHAAWEHDAVELADETEMAPETAIGEWMVASLADSGGQSQ